MDIIKSFRFKNKRSKYNKWIFVKKYILYYNKDIDKDPIFSFLSSIKQI